MTESPPVMDRSEEDVRNASEAVADRRGFASVIVASAAVVLALIVHAATSPGGTPPFPLAASGSVREDVETPARRAPGSVRTSRRSAERSRPVPAPATRGPSLRPDPKGPLFAAEGGRAQRLAPGRPGRGVALIFDDGPGPQTEEVLRELERAGATATFFLVGREAERRPDLARRLRDSGMELGNHTLSHTLMTPLDEHAQRREIRLGAHAIQRVAGVTPRFFRPPQIGWNPTTARTVTAEGEIGVLHTIDPQDWAGTGRGAILEAARNAKPGDVVALHDAGGDRTETVAALRPILRELARRRLRCVTVSELVGYPVPGTPGAAGLAGQRGERSTPPS